MSPEYHSNSIATEILTPLVLASFTSCFFIKSPRCRCPSPPSATTSRGSVLSTSAACTLVTGHNNYGTFNPWLHHSGWLPSYLCISQFIAYSFKAWIRHYFIISQCYLVNTLCVGEKGFFLKGWGLFFPILPRLHGPRACAWNVQSWAGASRHIMS